MAFSQRVTEGDVPLSPDHSSKTFTTRREPVRDLIHSLSNLYLESEPGNVEQEGDFDDSLLPPPSDEEDESLLTMVMASRMHKIECRMDSCEKSSDIQFKDMQHQLNVQSNRMTAIESLLQHILNLDKDHRTEIQRLGNSLSAKLEAGCGQIKVTLETKVQELGQATMDCLKWRDGQLRSLIQTSGGATSTPDFNHTVASHSSFRPVHCQTPIKLEFPKFGSLDGEDPITYLERCDEYLAIQSLNVVEILSMLPSVLTHTAKDWWLVEKKKVKTWSQFKSAFLQSFYLTITKLKWREE